MKIHTYEGGERAHTGTAHRSAKDFLPLVIVLTGVVILTWVFARWSGATGAADVIRNFMASFFLVFGAFKAIRLKGFADAFSVYDMVAKRSRTYALVYPFIELGLGWAFLFSAWLVAANVVTLAIMLVGALGVWSELRKKNQIPCACLGVVFKIPMTHVTLGEDLLMAAMAATMLMMLL